MGWDWKRIGKGIATGGLSELPGLMGIEKPEVESSTPEIQAQYGRAGGLNTQQDAFANVLRDRMMGKGPNPVQEQFKRNAESAARTGAASIASARGISPALAARLGANLLGSGAQTAAGQAAVLGQQQMIDAGNQYQTQLAGMGAQNLQQQAILQQALAAKNNAEVAAQSGYNQTLGGFWGGMMKGAGGAMGMGATGGGGAGMASGGVVDGASSRLGRFLGGALDLSSGGGVPGRAVVAGDSTRNDTVPAMLSPGEVVIPRTLADDPDGAADFVRALQRRSGRSTGYERIARLAEGGKITDGDRTFLKKVTDWWSASGEESEARGKEVADDVHAALPDWLSARSAVKRHRASLDATEGLER